MEGIEHVATLLDTAATNCMVPLLMVEPLADNTVVSNDYCRAVEMGSSILCRCGYDSTGSNKNLTDVLLALGGKVSVGAFRSYAAGGLESSVDILSATSIAQKSIMIIACFVSVWGVGIVFLTLSVPNLRLRRNQKLKKVRALKHRNDTVPPASPLTDDTSSTPLPLLPPPEPDVCGATKAPVEALPVEAYLSVVVIAGIFRPLVVSQGDEACADRSSCPLVTSTGVSRSTCSPAKIASTWRSENKCFSTLSTP